MLSAKPSWCPHKRISQVLRRQGDEGLPPGDYRIDWRQQPAAITSRDLVQRYQGDHHPSHNSVQQKILLHLKGDAIWFAIDALIVVISVHATVNTRDPENR